MFLPGREKLKTILVAHKNNGFWDVVPRKAILEKPLSTFGVFHRTGDIVSSGYDCYMEAKTTFLSSVFTIDFD